MKLWIFLPAYNEEVSLQRMFPKLRSLREDFPEDEIAILLLDDGSTDRTAEVAIRESRHQNVIVVRHPLNRGLGETERDGFEYLAHHCADEDIIIRLDCDDTHEPKYICALVKKIAEGYSVVNTSRFQPGGNQLGVGRYRSLISLSANLFMRVVFQLDGIKDYSCGFRAYRAKAIKDAVAVFGNSFLQMKGFGFTSTLEVIIKLHLLGGKFSEVPFILRYDQKASESKMVSATTIIGYLVMATLYHYPFCGWRAWKKTLSKTGSEPVGVIADSFKSIRQTKTIPARFGT